MNIIHTIDAMRQSHRAWRHEQQRIALVPTMGNLHAGHLALVQRAKQAADRVVVSIFVNPLQFGPKEDFANYPRTLEVDAQKLQALQIDALFAPANKEIYPEGSMPATRVGIPGLSDELCGVSRPQLFYGVTTVVTKLLNIVAPDVVVFGEKDFQQLLIVKQMVHDLNFPIEVLSCATSRESDGLAMSSRNGYLTAEQRNIAPHLYATLCKIRDAICAGNHDYEALCVAATKELQTHGFDGVDYVSVRKKATLQTAVLPEKTSDLVILAAVFLGKTRLIDNLLVVE